MIIIGIFLGPSATITAAVLAQNDKGEAKMGVDCQTTWSQAIKLHNEYPGVVFPYDGPAEDQCHVSKVLEQLNSQPAVPVPAPAPTR